MPEQPQNVPREDPISGVFTSEQVPQNRNPELTRWQLSPDEITEKIEHYLKGEIPLWDSEQDMWVWKHKGKRLMNDRGVRIVMSLLYPHIEKNAVLSTLSINEISYVMKFIHKHLSIHLASKLDEYEMDRNDLTLIMDIITNTIWFALKRAMDGAEKKFLSASERRIERTVERGQKKSWIPFIGGD